MAFSELTKEKFCPSCGQPTGSLNRSPLPTNAVAGVSLYHYGFQEYGVWQHAKVSIGPSQERGQTSATELRSYSSHLNFRGSIRRFPQWKGKYQGSIPGRSWNHDCTFTSPR